MHVSDLGTVACPRTHLLTNLQKFSSQFPGKVGPMVQQMKPECVATLQAWLAESGVALS